MDRSSTEQEVTICSEMQSVRVVFQANPDVGLGETLVTLDKDGRYSINDMGMLIDMN